MTRELTEAHAEFGKAHELYRQAHAAFRKLFFDLDSSKAFCISPTDGTEALRRLQEIYQKTVELSDALARHCLECQVCFPGETQAIQ